MHIDVKSKITFCQITLHSILQKTVKFLPDVELQLQVLSSVDYCAVAVSITKLLSGGQN